MKTAKRYPREVQERAVRMVQEHRGEHGSQWGAIASVAGKLGCTAETLRRWVRQAERDSGQREGPTTNDQERMKALEREVRELRQVTRFYARRQPILPRRSSTAGSNREGLHR